MRSSTTRRCCGRRATRAACGRAETLERFLADPEAMFPGMWMSRVPIVTAADRQALVRFIADPASR